MNLYVEDKIHDSKSCEMYFIFVVCFMFFHALIRCIKFLKAPALALRFMNVIKLLFYKVTFIEPSACVVSFKNFISCMLSGSVVFFLILGYVKQSSG